MYSFLLYIILFLLLLCAVLISESCSYLVLTTVETKTFASM
ncbi:hypothetical protein, unlikely [Trypanosoma brucei brucei TREU927]|uniref:Uncharacterized protein n=1 Tax=Trypanosoma brucei brucei (strain 927/4 GUTat10.1) TaxID=185431 RepID=Q4GYC5_TRYB2|nr:hypothetical protein, unlikely [Trypanosoma brucei brucei TREU927]CAJ16659.1 hypothetical protein, unlikely [Trypanosoma brucei brucei TREU927]